MPAPGRRAPRRLPAAICRPASASGRRLSRPCANGRVPRRAPAACMPWVPVAFGTGIAFYFAADHEPVLSAAAVVAIGFCALAFLLRRQKVIAAAVMIAAVAAGFAVATW